VELRLGQGVVEFIRHLFRRLSQGARIGHRQRCRDAVRKEEEVAFSRGDGVEEVESKTVVAGDQLAHRGLCDARNVCRG
jgi:hypothetical protein